MIDLKEYRKTVGFIIVVNSLETSSIQLPFDYTLFEALEYYRQVPRYIGLLHDGNVIAWRKGFDAIN